MNRSTKDFLDHFAGRIWLQTFPDDKILKTKQSNLAQCFGVYDTEIDASLVDLNRAGAGIYFCVNELIPEAKNRNVENVENVRAFFLDLDGAPLQPVLDSTALPDLVVRTSKDRFHCYWILDEKVKAERDKFREVQKNMAERYNGDKSINDLCRVMRLPGYYNMKSEPYLVRWIEITDKLKEDIRLRKIDAPNLLELNWR